MVTIQDRSLRKPSGSRNTSTRPRRKAQAGNNASLTSIGNKRVRTSTKRGGKQKKGLLSQNIVNVYDPKSKKHIKATIKEVKESKSNRNYVRRNIVTKGTIIETDKGLAKITNRPGQEGAINAQLQ